MGQSKKRHSPYTDDMNMHESRKWWDEQKDADERFQAALRAAGMIEGVQSEPSTEMPVRIRT